MYEELYSKVADALVEDGYIVLSDALRAEIILALKEIILNSDGFKKAGISNSNSLHVDLSKRSDQTKWLDEDGAGESMYLEFAQGLQEYLNRSLYLGLKYYEAHFAIYEEGDFYEKHLDSFRGSKNRVVTTVYYLNDEWNEKNGGELIVYDENDKELTTVRPIANTLVVFMSEKFPHEVLPAKDKRYSIAGWFRVD